MKDKLPYVKEYRDLLVYKKSLELAEMVFQETKSFPKEEIFSLTNQLRRSSRSIGAQIAEAWGKRLYVKHFISKLTDAIAELNETEHWLDIALNCEYITLETRNELKEKCKEIGRLLGGMISKADLFCEKKHTLKKNYQNIF
ncbi:MAG: four helix bundle protein [Anaerolineales bacterium]|nr:four helix bundle protein [Anaerolineales bacterium]